MAHKKKILSVLFALGALGSLATLAHRASAQTASFAACNGGIEFIDLVALGSSNTRLHIGCIENGVTKHVMAHVQEPGFPQYNRNLETLKLFASHAQTALLSGKQLQVYFDAISGGNNVITALSLRKQ